MWIFCQQPCIKLLSAGEPTEERLDQVKERLFMSLDKSSKPTRRSSQEQSSAAVTTSITLGRVSAFRKADPPHGVLPSRTPKAIIQEIKYWKGNCVGLLYHFWLWCEL
jgi:hypothetical protein